MTNFYNKNYYQMNRTQNDYGFRGQSSYNDNWEEENSNYGFNYYPQTEEKYFSNENEYQYNNDITFGNDDQKCKCNNFSNYNNNCRPCFRPCLPSFPCFKNNKNFDCRYKKYCDCQKDWNRKPCHDNYDKKGCHCRDYDNNGSNRFYFSGCIELKNNDNRF